MKQTSSWAGIAFLLTILSHSLYGHHATPNDYDDEITVDITGVLVRMEWINPHTIIHLEVLTENGRVQHWSIQGPTPNTLLRRGVNRNSLPTPAAVLLVDGVTINTTTLSIRGYVFRDSNCNADCRAYGTAITFPNGRTVSLE